MTPEEIEVSNLMCRHCQFFGSKCRCIDHTKIHFCRPYFSCDILTAHHTICGAFQPDAKAAPHVDYEWRLIGGFDEWHRLYIKQWRNGNEIKHISIIPAHTKKGADCSDNYYLVPYDDFVRCQIMQPDGIHYINHRYIKMSRSSPIGYIWIDEGPGILTYEQLEELNCE